MGKLFSHYKPQDVIHWSFPLMGESIMNYFVLLLLGFFLFPHKIRHRQRRFAHKVAGEIQDGAGDVRFLLLGGGGCSHTTTGR